MMLGPNSTHIHRISWNKMAHPFYQLTWTFWIQATNRYFIFQMFQFLMTDRTSCLGTQYGWLVAGRFSKITCDFWDNVSCLWITTVSFKRISLSFSNQYYATGSAHRCSSNWTGSICSWGDHSSTSTVHSTSRTTVCASSAGNLYAWPNAVLWV